MSESCTRPGGPRDPRSRPLNLHGRRLLVARVIDEGRPVAHAAEGLGSSANGPTAGSPASAPKVTPASATAHRARTAASPHGDQCRAASPQACDPLTGEVIRASKSTAVRYERPPPGDLIHIGVRMVGKFPDGGGWKAHGRGERPADKRGLGVDDVHAAVDDHSRMAYAEIVPDQQSPTCADFLLRASAIFAGHATPSAR